MGPQKVIPKPNYVCKTAKVIPNWTRLIPTLKTRNGSEMVCKMDNITHATLTGVYVHCFYILYTDILQGNLEVVLNSMRVN